MEGIQKYIAILYTAILRQCIFEEVFEQVRISAAS